jgi:hypothetical protein
MYACWLRVADQYSVIKAEFHLRRNIGYFVLQLYVPCGLIVSCSWVSFWIDPAAVPARVQLGKSICRSATVATQTGQNLVRFELFTAVTMKNVVFWDKKTFRTSQKTHYISATETSRLTVCRIQGFHGDDINTQFLPHRRHITSPLQIPAG